ncbi:MAG: NADH-quinone oxidoreductase subunit NuoN [Gammaproteobacteria bacterium]|nr:NADH-quinone oxidoreductase subunit NuoN [Gammaproteobacteria bacterium]
MTTALLNHMHLALPEITLLIAACVALLGDLFFPRRGAAIVFVVASVGLLLVAGESALFLGHSRELLFSKTFVSDNMAHLMKIFIAITVFLSLFYGRDYLEERGIPAGDYTVLALFSTLGMSVLVSAHSLLTVYLGLELFSLPMYAMTAIRRTETDGAEAAMKYFVMGAMASGILLYGMSLLFGATGALDFDGIAKVLGTDIFQKQQGLLIFSLVFLVVGVAFKLAAAPFHMWAPDVYDGAPSNTTLFISAAPKIAALGMLLRLLMLGWGDMVVQWQHLILVLALLSTGLGNILAIVQTNIKRLLAYSTISHAGYALFGVLVATSEGYGAALYYILVYALMSVGAFGLITLLSRGGVEVVNINDLRGLNQRKPWLAFLMMLILFSMAGVPPMVGFLTKLLVLKALVDAGLLWVAVLGLLFAVVGAFYYLRVIKVMYFDESIDPAPIHLPRSTQLIFSINGLSLLYLGLFPSALIATCLAAFS